MNANMLTRVLMGAFLVSLTLLGLSSMNARANVNAARADSIAAVADSTRILDRLDRALDRITAVNLSLTAGLGRRPFGDDPGLAGERRIARRVAVLAAHGGIALPAPCHSGCPWRRGDLRSAYQP